MPIVRAGMLAGFLSSRETATEIGLERSGGCMRADGFARQPIVRMTNVNVAPGDAGSLADLLADTGEGLYFETNRSWSIDDRRLQFQFATEVCREIRGGELGRLLDLSSEEVERARLACAREAAARSKAFVVLKGDDTLVTAPSGRVAVSRGSAPGLATAGTGDVLSGGAGALLARGLGPLDAGSAAAHLHGRAGERAAGRGTTSASQVLEHWPARLDG